MRKLVNEDCLVYLANMQAQSVDSLVTDPPAGISFMGKAWDSNRGGRLSWIEWLESVMVECLRVLKPGAHGLVWALPRTSHWTATALEQAGFEIRDVVVHIFGSGFPKSLDISKAMDKAAGIEGPIIGKNPAYRERQLEHDTNWETAMRPEHKRGPGSDEAKKWEGWGTALKPANEHWILVRKPIGGKTVAKNVQKHGTGGLNIDASRIESESIKIPHAPKGTFAGAEGQTLQSPTYEVQGRFPANLIVDECAVAELDRQSGQLKSGSGQDFESSTGGASRFFYCAKASRKDKGTDNTHPTVKSTKLMEYLIKLITPPAGIVLDPFMGSGSTGVAALSSGFGFVGIECEKAYYDIAMRRTHLIS